MNIRQLGGRRAIAMPCVGLLIAAAAAQSACAQHQDVRFHVASGTIVMDPAGAAPVWTDVMLAPGFPPAPGDPPVQQDDPGFNAPSGSFAPGAFIGLNIVQPLWYWDGQMLAEPSAGTVFELENVLSDVLLVDAAPLPEPVGFDFAVAGDEGGIHQHVLFRLPDPVSPDGAYGIVLELTTPGLVPSDPFLIVFNQRLPDDEFDLGVEAILNASGILAPELLAGDYSGNGAVEQADLDLVLLHWGSGGTPPPEGWIGPAPNGTIDQAELDAVLLNWGNRLDAATNAMGVPEPSALRLLFLAAGGASAALMTRRDRVNLKQRR